MTKTICLLVMAVVALGAGATPHFEVASIRRCDAGDRAGANRSPDANPTPGRVYLPCTTVKNLIHMAYGMSRPYAHTALQVPIEGGPKWMDSDRYTILAKAEGDPGPEVTHGPMLQSLLEDRFHLKIHREMREIPVYALTVAKGGPKLEAFREGSCVEVRPDAPAGKPFCGVARSKKDGNRVTYEFMGMSVDEFAQNLGVNSGPKLLDRPVVDKTGLEGRFNFRFTFEREDGVDDVAAILMGIRELGLRLESAKGMGEFLVVDSVARASDN